MQQLLRVTLCCGFVGLVLCVVCLEVADVCVLAVNRNARVCRCLCHFLGLY